MITRTALIALTATAALFASTLSSRADVLASRDFAMGSNAPSSAQNLYIEVGFVNEPLNSFSNTATLFNTSLRSPSDAGKTFTVANNADDPNWSKVVALLTDGKNNYFGTQFATDSGPFSGTDTSETQMIWGRSDDPRVDLSGYVIDSISYTLNTFTITPDPNVAGWTDYMTDGLITVNGHLASAPEPASCLLAAAALPLLSRRRKPAR